MNEEARRKPTRAAIYARISEDAERRGEGVTRQVEDSTALAERRGWTLGPWAPFVDNDISASTKSKARRPAYERMMELVEEGEIDGILFYSNSRLTRRPREFEDIIELVLRTGVQLSSVVSGEANLSTADGRQIARWMAAGDAAEAERISERVSRAFVQRREQGTPNPSSRAFGFEKGGIKVIESEAKLIQEAASRILDEGWSLGMVVKDWNERKIKTVRGADGWSRQTLKRTLVNPRTAGLVSLDGEVLGHANFKGILTRDQQDKIKVNLEANRKSGVVYKTRQHWLAGFLVCGKCGKPMKVNALYAPDGSFRKDSYIVCSRSQHGCGNVKRNLLHVMEYVDDLVRAWIEMLTPEGDGDPEETVAAQIASAQAGLAEVEQDIEDLKAMFRANEIRLRDYNEALSTLRDRQEVCEKALDDLQVDRALPVDIDLMEVWDDVDVEPKRVIMGRVFDHIKLHPIGRVGPIRAKEMVSTATECVPA